MTEIRAAIIGTGGIANSHANALRNLQPRVRIVAAVDVDPSRVEAFCAKHEIPASYTDSGEMLSQERPDLVHVCTPPLTHCDLSVQALEAGAWVLCEKPFCGSLAELDRIAEAEQRTGNYCSCVFQWRFGSAGQQLKALIDSSALGQPLVGLCQTTWYRDAAYYQVPWRGKWSTELGGPTMGHGIHAMDLFLWLLGDWQEVTAAMGTLDRDIEVEDTSMAIVRFENGAMGSVLNSVLCPRQETRVRLDFRKATMEVTGLYGYSNKNWKCTPLESYKDDPALANLFQDGTTDVPSSHQAEIKAVLDAMERDERPPVSGAEARRTLEFITGLYKSAATGSPVQRGSIGRDDPFYSHVGGTLAGASAK